MGRPKIVAIGVGSFSFGVELLRDVFQTDDLRECELALVDVDPDRLAEMTGLAQRLNEASGHSVAINATPDRCQALPGADFVVTSIELNRDPLWALDHEICLRHDIPSVLSENGGPGGLSHALRTVPPVVAIARDVGRICPGALMLNYTNPEGRVCLAIRRHAPGVRAVGLCHGVAETVQFAAAIMERQPEEIDLHAAGVNHFTWMTSLTDATTGADLYPLFRERVAALPPEVWPLCRLLLDRFGIFPTTGDNHVGEYIGWSAEVTGTKGYDFARTADMRKLALENIRAWAAGEKPVDTLLSQPSHESRVGLSCTGIMADVVAGRGGRRPSLIVPNDGYIDNVSADAVVEVPGMVQDSAVCGLAVGALPGPVASMVQNEVEVQKLVVDAAMTGSRDLALQALLIDPVVNSARKAEAVLDDILLSHAAWLPQFA